MFVPETKGCPYTQYYIYTYSLSRFSLYHTHPWTCQKEEIETHCRYTSSRAAQDAQVCPINSGKAIKSRTHIAGTGRVLEAKRKTDERDMEKFDTLRDSSEKTIPSRRCMVATDGQTGRG